ncbi:hypothetical protein BASA62_003804 [Batrachochytrium salamandrivorans]|nr:hypothetical protein BASA62_003804 [Batrachochytrium salamandrivorans]
MVVAPLDSSTAIFSPTLRRYIILSKDWPLLIADFLQTDAWLPNITDTLRENCVADLPHYQMANDTFYRILADGRSKWPEGIGGPTMKQDLKDAIRRCPECQLDQSAAGSFASTPIRPIPSVAQPFERWGVDFIQDLPETKAGKPPHSNGHRLRNSLGEGVKEFEALQRIRHHATTPYHPRTNGMVERMHAMVGHAITTLTQGQPERWDEYLAQTIFAIRVRKHAVTQHSPFFLLYGVDPRLPGDTAPPRETMMPLDQVEQMEERAEFTARSLEEIGQVRSAAYARSKAQAEAMRIRNKWDPDSDDYYFKIGDMVKLKNHTKNKFEFDWKGPYHIVDVGYPGTYWIMEPSGRRFRFNRK